MFSKYYTTLQRLVVCSQSTLEHALFIREFQKPCYHVIRSCHYTIVLLHIFAALCSSDKDVAYDMNVMLHAFWDLNDL